MPKKKPKGKKIERITKLITDGKLERALELADVSDIEALFGIGVQFGQKEVHDAAYKIFDRVTRLNPNLAEAWLNKGVALGNLGKYDEEIKCYDEAIKLNPNYDKAWSNKGIALGNLGKYDEEIKCYDEAIKLNPNLAEAYGNKGIILLNTRRYDEAKAELITARKLFSKKGMKKDVNKAYRYELLAINGSELLSRLRPLDEQFMSSLNSQSLAELKENSLKISESMEGVIKAFEEEKLPSDAISFLISKAICFTILSDALSFKKVNLKKLEDAKRVFKDWKLNTFVMALNSLDNFIYGLGKYKSLEGIPEAEEKFLLQVLRISYILDGKLTDEITSKIRGESFTAKPTAIEKEPEIKYVSIADTKKSRVRVCLVQLDFSLTKRFPYTLSEKDKLKKKIFEALRIAKRENVDVICFPELSFAKGWTEEIKDNYKDMMIICGSFYEESNRNLCQIIMGTKDYPYAKCHCSIMEEPNGEGLKRGNNLLIFQTKYGIISVLMCVDFDYEYARISEYVKSKINKPLNLVINPRCDIDNEHKFQAKSNLSIDLPDGSRSPTFILHINAKRVVWGNNIGGGGTTIIGYEHIHRIEKYKTDGLRPEDEIKYKIYEAKDEMMLIADLNLNIEEITGRRTNIHNFYEHDSKGWKVLDDKRIWS